MLRAREVELKAAIDRQVVAHVGSLVATLGQGEVEGLSPSAFEAHCAQTPGGAAAGRPAPPALSGDQGADIIADKDGMRLIVQCKLLGRPVGNKAVQEAHSAQDAFRRAARGRRHQCGFHPRRPATSRRRPASSCSTTRQLGEIEQRLRAG